MSGFALRRRQTLSSARKPGIRRAFSSAGEPRFDHGTANSASYPGVAHPGRPICEPTELERGLLFFPLRSFGLSCPVRSVSILEREIGSGLVTAFVVSVRTSLCAGLIRKSGLVLLVLDASSATRLANDSYSV